MMTRQQEQYVLRHLSLIDMERTINSIENIELTQNDDIKEALFRDAVVSYIKPFSDNRGEHVKKNFKLKKTVIPKHLRNIHTKIENIRNKLFAHNDLSKQDVEFGPGTSFSIRGYEKVFYNDLFEPLNHLAKAVHYNLLQEMSTLRINGL